MISTILSVIDRLLKFKEYRDQRLHRIYEQLLEPAFNDLLLVHRDYIQMFEKVHELLPRPNEIGTNEFIKKLSEAIDYVREKRVEFEPVRVNLKSLMVELQGDAPFLLKQNRKVLLEPEAESFIGAVLEYLESHHVGIDTVGHVLLYEMVDSINGMRSLPHRELSEGYLSSIASNHNELLLTHAALQDSISEKVSTLRENWSRVCESYAQLKVSVTTRR